VFNDILLGKASVEPKPPDPYREPASAPPPAVTLDARYHANQQMDAAAFAAAHESLRRSKSSHWWLRVALLAVAAMGLGFAKYAMRRQYNSDMRQAAGLPADYQSGDRNEYVQRANAFADAMCACTGYACAESIDRDFRNWSMSLLGKQADADDVERVEQDVDRYTTCRGHFMQQ
jgi:hypothetical protein